MAKGKILTGLLVAVAGVLGARAAFARKRKVTRVANPFSDAACTKLRSNAEVNRWIDAVAFRRYQDAYNKNPVTTSDPADLQRILVFGYVDYALKQLPTACSPLSDRRSRQDLYHAVWCKITSDLVGRGRIDPVLENFSQWCENLENNPLKPEAP